MKKPNSTEAMLKIIFLWIGVMFVGMGLLSLAGVLKPSSHSQIQDTTQLGICFVLLGGCFAAAGILCGVLVSRKEKLRQELLVKGRKITGTVEKVYLQRFLQFNRQSPYRIRYSFIYQGEVYHGKSCFLWEKPDLAEGDTISVYADGQGRSTIKCL